MTTNLPFQQQQPAFKKVGNIAELVRMTPEELKLYNISIDSYRTNLSVMKNERAEGIAEGMAKGLAKGLAKGRAEGRAEEKAKAIAEKMEIARQLLATGIPIDQISSIMKLPISEILALRP